jgi:hypothetical protein
MRPVQGHCPVMMKCGGTRSGPGMDSVRLSGSFSGQEVCTVLFDLAAAQWRVAGVGSNTQARDVKRIAGPLALDCDRRQWRRRLGFR